MPEVSKEWIERVRKDYLDWLERQPPKPPEPKERWNDALMVHDWPEMGPGSITIEELYQMFKARLAKEQPDNG